MEKLILRKIISLISINGKSTHFYYMLNLIHFFNCFNQLTILFNQNKHKIRININQNRIFNLFLHL